MVRLDFKVLPKYAAGSLYIKLMLVFSKGDRNICSLLPLLNEKYFQSECSVVLFFLDELY